MTNTSESSDTKEQAKTATNRSRTSRSKPENTTPVSQELQNKPTTTRRSNPTPRVSATSPVENETVGTRTAGNGETTANRTTVRP
ncbi:MAG TPA: hypothetical protein VFN35_06470, partial [Ktedonobacteraceae bacterium]|nr:hypothetical protein [Ktedonobacteraceae bacterium]